MHQVYWVQVIKNALDAPIGSYLVPTELVSKFKHMRLHHTKDFRVAVNPMILRALANLGLGDSEITVQGGKVYVAPSQEKLDRLWTVHEVKVPSTLDLLLAQSEETRRKNNIRAATRRVKEFGWRGVGSIPDKTYEVVDGSTLTPEEQAKIANELKAKMLRRKGGLTNA